MTARLLPATVGLATLALALGYGLGAQWTGTAAALAAGLLWLAAWWRRLPWTAAAGLVAFTILAAGGIWLGLGAGWMLLALIAALAAWDLDAFARRLAGADRIHEEEAVERRHLARLGLVIGLGGFLALLALGIELRLTFLPALLLGLLAVIGLGRALSHIRQESD
ncbi:MAG: hypothetical protein PVF47_02325 [Anaerolineae bacterium]|jgi:hypothetical protein